MQAVTGETDCYGKLANELGTLTFENGAFTGTLNRVTGYAGFNSDPSEQDGYFLPFTISDDGEVKMYVKDSAKQVVCDKAPIVNVVFLGASKDVAEKATLKLVKNDKTTTISMGGITFNDGITKTKVRTKKESE